MVTIPVRCSIQSTRNWLASDVCVLILPIMLGAPSLDHVGLLLVQAGLDVELVLDVELAVLPYLGVGVAVHPARRRAPDPPTVDVVESAVARTQIELLLGKPPHGTPEVGARVAQDVELAHDLLALGFRKALALLVQDGRTLRLAYHVAVGPLRALLLDRGLPREPDGIVQFVLHSGLLRVGELLLDGPLPVDLLQGKGDFEVRGLLRRDLGDRTDFLPAGPHVRFTEHVGLDDRSQDERGWRYSQYGPDYRPHHAEAEEVAAGYGIFLQLRHASPLLDPPGFTCRTRSAADSVAPCSQADYIPCKAPWNWTS